jgi:hypothetical protein
MDALVIKAPSFGGNWLLFWTAASIRDVLWLLRIRVERSGGGSGNKAGSKMWYSSRILQGNKMNQQAADKATCLRVLLATAPQREECGLAR